jgi:hypothetical protein
MIPLVRINAERLAEMERGIVWFIWSNKKTALVREGCHECSYFLTVHLGLGSLHGPVASHIVAQRCGPAIQRSTTSH